MLRCKINNDGTVAFKGVSADFATLPTVTPVTVDDKVIKELRTGSSFFDIEAKNVYFFDEVSKTWI